MTRTQPLIEHKMRVCAFDRAALSRVPSEGETLSRRRNSPDYRIDHDTGCWEWLKGKHRGYGRNTIVGHDQYAHRAYYAAAFGPIPEGSHVHHRCHNPGCVNPWHMEVHSHSDHLAMHKQADSSLTWDDVREIRRLWATGEWTSEQLGDRFGIEKSMAWRIVDNRNWVDPMYTPPIFRRECGLPECPMVIESPKPWKRFCCGHHRTKHNQRIAQGYYERRVA